MAALVVEVEAKLSQASKGSLMAAVTRRLKRHVRLGVIEPPDAPESARVPMIGSTQSVDLKGVCRDRGGLECGNAKGEEGELHLDVCSMFVLATAASFGPRLILPLTWWIVMINNSGEWCAGSQWNDERDRRLMLALCTILYVYGPRWGESTPLGSIMGNYGIGSIQT